MIKSLTVGKGLTVAGGINSPTYINMSNPSAGILRYNGNNTEVYDGSNWIIMQSSHAVIEFDADTLSLIEWARKKREEERILEKLAQEHSSIKDLVDQINQKKDQIKMVQTVLNSNINRPQELMGS